MKKVGVVILNYKVADKVINALKSVQQSDYANLQIVIVDNASGDDIQTQMQKYSEVHLIENSANLGYSGGNNIGIKWLLEQSAELIFVLNPDAFVVKDTISRLVDSLEKNQAQIASPKIYFYRPESKEKVLWYAGGIFDKANVLGSHRGVDQVDTGQYDRVEETDYATGCAILIDGEVIKKIGLFDDQYFLYYEDSDFSYRAKQAGYKVIYEPSAIVYHENAKSTGLGSPLQDYYITRNRMLLASKFLPFRTRFALFREAVYHLNQPVRRQAFLDFLMGHFGKREY